MKHSCAAVMAIVTSVLLLASGTGVASDNALQMAINGPHQLSLDSTGHLYIVEEYGHRILRLDLSKNTIAVVAGNGKECCRKEGVDARKSSVYAVYSIATDRQDNVYIGGRNADDGAFVRIVHGDTGLIETLARGHAPDCAVDVKTLHANLSDPHGISVTPAGALLVSADQSEVIVELGPTTRLFGGVCRKKGYSGDGGPATLAQFNLPGALAVDGAGNVFVADYFNHRVRRIDAQTGIVTTVAGNGREASSGDGGAAIKAGVRYPYAIAVDSAGNLFVIENGEFTVRRVDAVTGIIERVVGTGRAGYSGDGGPATRADISPVGVATDRDGNLYVSDIQHNRVRRIDATTGTISTIAGNGLPHRKAIIE